MSPVPKPSSAMWNPGRNRRGRSFPATKTWWLVGMMALVALRACEPKKEDAKAKTPKVEEKKTDDKKKVEEKKTDDKKPGQTASASQVLVDPGAETPEAVSKAIAVVHATEGNKVEGTVVFAQTPDGLAFTSTFKGLPGGSKHAHHVHLYGDCSGADGKTAGTHFNLEGSSLNPPKDIKRITGDLGDVEADKEGNATSKGVLKTASLQGKYSILGRAIIIHAKPNDPKSPPIGAAGGRLGCGVIGLTKK